MKALFLFFAGVSIVFCQTVNADNRHGAHDHREKFPPPMRKHTANQAEPLALLAATEKPITESTFHSVIEGDWRIITANAISDHATGRFPNRNNPNTISEQDITARVPARPSVSDIGKPRRIKEFGWAINGIPFDPGTREHYKGNRTSRWRYEALSGAVALGLDESHAHVQPHGKYHYHGLPSLLLKNMKLTSKSHSPQIGWAADGFPIYALYGFADPNNQNSSTVEMKSGWRLKKGNRPSGEGNPGGKYDGTFSADYEYLGGDAAVLDECNGRITMTPDYPKGIYAYYLTTDWPVVPRCVRGKTDPLLRTHTRPGRFMRRVSKSFTTDKSR